MKLAAVWIASALLVTASVNAQTLRPDQQKFRELYQELVETNTTLSAGSCTLAAERMAARLEAAGIPKAQLTLFAIPEKPKEGGLVAVYPGSDPAAKPILLLAHIDVVEANRADWSRDPFVLVEENGYFYGRGTSDDKAQAAIWTDMLVRFAGDRYQPRRTIKLALTCGEETSGAFNGAEWLTKNRRQLIDAEFALNETGGGRTDGKAVSQGGKLVMQGIQVGEKAYVDFVLTAINPGGHSSLPVRDNAIYAMTDALAKVRALTFPLQFNEVTRVYYREVGTMRGGPVGQAMIALAANPNNKAAEALVSRDKLLNALLRTTCVATRIEGGHARNALPQRVTANVNCRMLPGRTLAATQAALVRAINDPAIQVAPHFADKPIAQVPKLDPAIVAPMTALAAKYWPGVPVIPSMATGATDAVYTGAAGIPTYGVPGLWADPDGNGTHGLNERIEAAALYTGRDYLTDLVKAYSR